MAAYNLAAGLLLLLSSALADSSGSGSGAGSDQACLAPLETLFSCLSYAQGKAPLPSPTCCTNMDKVFRTQKKCLCDLIAASFHGGIAGLPPFNRTVALHMPSACNVPADPSKCPGLLGIPASSPEAKEFSDAALKPNGSSVTSNATTLSTNTVQSRTESNAACSRSTLTFMILKSLLLLLCVRHL